ncbi:MULTISPECIES: hypothetical protein [unclassified Streptomyces]|uniref:hypothetical protein n=1 Tax=unclassified Streptomyces TaxID=2593676 RepID=UPI002966B40E|nr:hypothetical protein [Streptomyces sp. SJL17-1]
MATTTMRLTPAVNVQRNASEAVPRRAPEPIYAELAQQWQTDGRLIPGQDDEEWTPLARQSPWPTR